ncbi:sulfotransferase 2B1 [Oncorhynchus tshawytscha]|uniref:Sulfotransferase n=1 Tax=Oncorhynchus tshawytscha TaxID=74940 RepID=A0A8C8CMY7_ONCTS|nr:sulfotransferase 2B1 [Oncorhynchus tshawytscha]
MARLDMTETFHHISFPGHIHTQDSLNYALHFQFRDRDTVIATYPKSGTTWMQEIVTLVKNRGDPQLSKTVPNWARAPWLEQHYSAKVLEATQGDRIITTHLPYNLLSSALQGSKAKVIYVARNPKDVAVSYYHFHKMAKFLPEPNSFDEFLDSFLEGSVSYGSWFDHVKGWTSQAGVLANGLYISYEEMWLDLQGSMERISSFLHCPLVGDELTNSLRHCSFSSMSDNAMVNYTQIPKEIMDHSKGKFMRKGKIGDWRNTFTEEQIGIFDTVYSYQMKDCPLTFMWECPPESCGGGGGGQASGDQDRALILHDAGD